jgi:glucose/mannose transport system substrate-binding protein
VRFSLAKGSIPARLGVTEAAFDACGRRAIEDFARADAAGTAFPAMGTASAATRETFTDAVSQQFQSNAAPEEGVEALTGAAQNEK